MLFLLFLENIIGNNFQWLELPKNESKTALAGVSIAIHLFLFELYQRMTSLLPAQAVKVKRRAKLAG
jgi:hypothetical protein